MPKTTAAELHQALIDELKRQGHIRSRQVEAALRAVPRHLFLPGVPLAQVYRDEAVTTKRLGGVGVSSASQPVVVAVMLEQLKLEPGHRVLEIGAGTGYNAALMAYIVGDGGEVVTIDIDDDIIEGARQNLRAAGFGRVKVVCGDGAFGYPQGAPYDRIVLTVAAWDLAPAWTEQLRAEGILLVPLWLRGTQKTIAFQKKERFLESASVSDCSFMPLRGELASLQGRILIGPAPGLVLTLDDGDGIEGEAVHRWLTGPGHDRPTDVEVNEREVWRDLSLWLALREPSFCTLARVGKQADTANIPYLFRWPELSATLGLVGWNGLCVLTRPPGQRDLHAPLKPFELWIRSYGEVVFLQERLMEAVAAWDGAGRSASERLRVRAYPIDTEPVGPPGGYVIPKRWTRLALEWG